MVQIGGYLTPDEHSEFKRYAAAFQFTESSLANLLIVRELRRQRLPKLRQLFASNAPLKERARITAHQSNERLKQTFDAHAQGAGVSPDQAASIIFRAELNERWLQRAVDSG